MLLAIAVGTAVTLDVIAVDRADKGGIIAPGINLSLDALIDPDLALDGLAIFAERTEIK